MKITLKIQKNKLLSNLFKSKVYTKNIEKAYSIAYKNFTERKIPQNINI